MWLFTIHFSAERNLGVVRTKVSCGLKPHNSFDALPIASSSVDARVLEGKSLYDHNKKQNKYCKCLGSGFSYFDTTVRRLPKLSLIYACPWTSVAVVRFRARSSVCSYHECLPRCFCWKHPSCKGWSNKCNKHPCLEILDCWQTHRHTCT